MTAYIIKRNDGLYLGKYISNIMHIGQFLIKCLFV